MFYEFPLSLSFLLSLFRALNHWIYFLDCWCCYWYLSDVTGIPGARNLKPCSANLQTLCESGNEGCYATMNLITFARDMWHPLFPDQLFLTSRRPFLIIFTTKSYQLRNTHSIQILHTVTPNNCFFKGEFLFVRRKRHTRFRSVFSSYQIMV